MVLHLRWLDLFSGIGGFHLGLTRAGHTITEACEIDRHAASVYARQFPGTKIHNDVRKINPDELEEFDAISAGFPCQAFSVAGKRLGFEESRGTVFFEIARITKQRRPRYLLLENVGGLLSHDNGRTFATILGTLHELGYNAQWQILNSKYWVPQNRARVFIVANLRDRTDTPKIFPVREGNKKYSTPQEKAPAEGQWLWDGVYPTFTAQPGARPALAEPKDIKIMGEIPNQFCNNGKMLDIRGISPTRVSDYNQSGFVAIPKLNQLAQVDLKHQYGGRIYDSRGIARAVTTRGDEGTAGIYAIPKNMVTVAGKSTELISLDDYDLRFLTPTEVERLQSFPDGWTKLYHDGKEVSDTQRYKQLGNSVTVDVIQFVGEKLDI